MQSVQNAQSIGRDRAAGGRALRNPAFANRAAFAADPNARQLASSTFHGRFFDPRWRRHRVYPSVIGWVGPLFWPYAYSDVVDYAFYPYAYDTFWPYAYDDVYDGMFGAYAQGYGGSYASVARQPNSKGRSASDRSVTGRSPSADLCSGQTAGLT